MSHESKLYRSRTNRILFGVCAGIAKRYGLEPVLVRIIFVVLAFLNGVGFVLYVLLFLFVPQEPGESVDVDRSKQVKDFVHTVEQKAENIASEVRDTAQSIKKEFIHNDQDDSSAK